MTEQSYYKKTLKSKGKSPAVLESIFTRSGERGNHTSLFSDLDSGERLEVKKKIGIIENENPIIVCQISEKRWCVVTDIRVVWCKSDMFYEVLAEDLVDVTFDTDSATAASAKSAADLGTLRITRKDGQVHLIELEPGKPFVGFWNTLKFLVPNSE